MLHNCMFQQNLHFDLIHKVQGYRNFGNPCEVHFSHDKGTSIDPIRESGSDNAIPNQCCSASNPKRGQQPAAVFVHDLGSQEETDGDVRSFGNVPWPEFIQWLVVLQSRAIVPTEYKISFLEIRPHRFCKLNMSASTYRKVFPAFGENLSFQMGATLPHPLLIAVSRIIQRRTPRQNNQILRLD